MIHTVQNGSSSTPFKYPPTSSDILCFGMQMNSVDHNLIIANYGASQGFDTDDGSRYKRREEKRREEKR